MDDRNSLAAQTREGIDACRPHRGDERLPELAVVFERIENEPASAQRFDRVQHIDVAMQAVMHDVPVPARLADRLLERLQAEERQLRPAEVAPPSKRGRALVWQVGLAASLLIVASIALAWKWLPAQPANVVTLAETWNDNLRDQWQPMATAPRALAVPVRLSVPPRGWQPTATLLGYKAVAYDFSRAGRRATLFVVQVAPEGELPSSPPDSPQYSAGGRLLAAWVTGNRMCLLVVEGDDRAYRDLIRPRLGPIARAARPAERVCGFAKSC